MRRLSAALILIISLLITGLAIAGQFEDAIQAYQLGDFKTAYRLFKPLAEQGLPEAQHNLGLMYVNGQGVSQDYTEAVMWYRKAAEHGVALAQNNLGIMYRKGQGVTQDYAEAVMWYRKAADQGEALAQFNLGVMFFIGQGVPQDYAEAAKWYWKAADQGLASAQFNLGVLFFNGQGVPQDYVLAHMWLNLATTRLPSSEKEDREKATKNRDLVASKMTPAQIAEAQRSAGEWKPKKER